MTQYRITSSDFVTEGERGDLDAYLTPQDLKQIRELTTSPLAIRLLDRVALENVAQAGSETTSE